VFTITLDPIVCGTNVVDIINDQYLVEKRNRREAF